MEIDNLKVEQSLPVISFDYDSLRQWALSITEKYKDLVVTENDVKSIKKEMAELNKAKDKLNRARIDTVQAISAPIREFEEQIKDVCGLFDTTYSALGEQVKAFENQEREEKRSQIEGIIEFFIRNVITENPTLEGKIALSVKDRWLNKSVSISTIKTEIEAEIDKQVAAEREIQLIEQREAERRLLIENAVKAANEKYRLDLPVSQFMGPAFTSLEVDAQKAIERIESVFQEKPRNEHISRKIAQPELVHAKPEIEPEKYVSRTTQGNSISIVFTATFTPEQESQVREILEQNQFMRIKRQLDSIGVQTSYEKLAENAYSKEVANG